MGNDSKCDATHAFAVGDRAVFTNEYGVCFGVKTITSLETRSYDFHGQTVTKLCYHYEDTDTPWFPSEERFFKLATEEDLTATPAELHKKHGFPTTEEQRAALLDGDPWEGEQ